MMLFRVLKRNNNLPWMIPLHQITHSEIPFFPHNPLLIRNGAAACTRNHSSPFTAFFSAAASNLRNEPPKIEQPVIDFFHSYGFTDTQMRRFIHKCPSVRSIKTVKPKLEYLLAFGFSPSELIRTVCFSPCLLHTSLSERIQPNLTFLKTTFGSNTPIIKAVSKRPWLIIHSLEKHVIPIINLLRDNGIPMDKITLLLASFPRTLNKHPNVIIEAINKLKGLGVNPSSSSFIRGMNIIVTSKKETWERKMELFKSFGWSEEETLSAFSRQPACMQLSEDKVTEAFIFLKEKLQWDSAMVLRRTCLLTYSLHGRTIPRCAVLNVLAKNGLWNGRPTLQTLFSMGETKFKEKFVDNYKAEVPQVIDAYQGKLEFTGFEKSIIRNQLEA